MNSTFITYISNENYLKDLRDNYEDINNNLRDLLIESNSYWNDMNEDNAIEDNNYNGNEEIIDNGSEEIIDYSNEI